MSQKAKSASAAHFLQCIEELVLFVYDKLFFHVLMVYFKAFGLLFVLFF